MHIFEIIKPGTWLKISNNPTINFTIANYLRQLTDHFYEANISLNLFIEQKNKNNEYFKADRLTLAHKDNINLNVESEPSIRNRMRKKVELKYKDFDLLDVYDQIRNEIEIEVEREKCKNTNIPNFKSEALIRLEITSKVKSEFKNYNLPDKSKKTQDTIDIEVQRENWRQGDTPFLFNHKKVFIYAKSFLFSVDNFEKEVEKLYKDELLRNKIKPLKDELTTIFPHLREVRNSAHHYEDRVRGEKFGKKINLKPIDNNSIYAPNGGVLILNQLSGNNYGCTLGDGTFGEVEVSFNTMNKLQIALQDFLDSIEWEGNIEIMPK